VTFAGFDLALPSRVAFGPGRAAELVPIATALGDRVLVVTGANPERVGHLVQPLRAAAGASAAATVQGEPTIEDARVAATAGRSVDADVVIAIGGGSAIDLAKAAAMLLGNGGDPMDYIEVVGAGRPITQPSVPLVAVPTTAGTGAEVTANAVLAVPEHRVKASLRHPSMVPRHAIVDPELTLGCPPPVTAAAGMDALTQCLEPYVSNRANPVTDGWARTGLLAAARGLRVAHADGSDLPARTDMALCSLMGGLSLANAKLGAVHGFSGVLGGMTGAAHGTLCAALLAPVCRANLARADATLRARYTDIATWLTGDRDAAAEDGLAWIERTCAMLGVPGLGELGLRAADVPAAAEGAARASSMKGNPVELTADELAAILRAAL
jgi:alcohol dehydrogenase class IV